MNFLRTGFTMLAVFAVILQSSAQIKEYVLDATHPTIENVQPIDMKGINPQGTTLTINSRYFSKNGKPWLPVMGEFHYIRYPEQYLEEELVKMKAGGLLLWQPMFSGMRMNIAREHGTGARHLYTWHIAMDRQEVQKITVKHRLKYFFTFLFKVYLWIFLFTLVNAMILIKRCYTILTDLAGKRTSCEIIIHNADD